MKLYRSIHDVSLPASACAIGMFDGVHIGHRMVLENALREARIHQIDSVVFSFANHPQFLTNQTPTQLLSSLDERLAAFEQMGFDHALIPDFDDWLKNMPADIFIQQVLQEHLGVKSVTVGYDHRFGKSRSGDGEMLRQVGMQSGFDAQIIEPVRVASRQSETGGGQIVSSTLIRKLLAYGDVGQAQRLLGRPYSLSGKVVAGMQRGRTLGFPTANLAPDEHRLVPGVGTYGGYASLNGQTYAAVCNIGFCPTFGDQLKKQTEVHLLDYDGPEFYDNTVQMMFLEKIRDERKFPNVDALIQQIHVDCQTARLTWSALADQPASGIVS